VRLGNRLAAENDFDRPRRGDDIDPFVRVARVDEDLLVLLVPVIDLVPVERDEITDRSDFVVRVWVAPHGILGYPLAGPDRPV